MTWLRPTFSALSDSGRLRGGRSAFLLTAMLALALTARAEESLDTIIIDRGYDQQTRIAVVPFARTDAPIPVLNGLDPLDEVVAFDLARSGQFAALSRDNMLSYPSKPSEVFYRDWRILGIEYLVVGRVLAEADGRVTVSYHLFDVFNEREVVAERLTATPADWRALAHRVADSVYERITGVPGAFSTKLLYVLVRNLGSRDVSFSLEVADADGARARSIFTSNQPLLSASWSPDGQRVAYVSFETGRPSIVLQELATGQRTLLPRFEGLNGAPVFSPDGKQLAMVLSRDGNPEIYLMNLDDRGLRRITRNRAIDTEPSWLPDGRSLVFTSDRGLKPQIYRMDLQTRLPERLTYVGDYNARARVLPDGKHMVFVHRRQGIFHIAWMDLQSGDVRVLTETSLDESPSLAPNGAMLIYATQVGGRGILGVVSVDGRVRYRLPSSTGDVREPAWSPYLPSVVRAQPLREGT